MPLLEGLDGKEKMSKSLGNYVGISEPPQEIFGKLMSISDALMWRYIDCFLRVRRDGREVEARVEAGGNRATSRRARERDRCALPWQEGGRRCRSRVRAALQAWGASRQHAGSPKW